MTDEKRSNRFQIGQTVALAADPLMVGAVIEVRRGDRETRDVVFHAGRQSICYESQLVPIEVPAERRELASPADFHAHLTAHQLGQPGLSALYSLHSGRIDFIPYQFRPVLKFLRADRLG